MGTARQVTGVISRKTGVCCVFLKSRIGRLAFGAELRFLDVHVFEFAGIKDFSTFQAFHEFSIFIAGYDLHARVFTLFHAFALIGKLRRRDWFHTIRSGFSASNRQGLKISGIGVF